MSNPGSRRGSASRLQPPRSTGSRPGVRCREQCAGGGSPSGTAAAVPELHEREPATTPSVDEGQQQRLRRPEQPRQSGLRAPGQSAGRLGLGVSGSSASRQEAVAKPASISMVGSGAAKIRMQTTASRDKPNIHQTRMLVKGPKLKPTERVVSRRKPTVPIQPPVPSQPTVPRPPLPIPPITPFTEEVERGRPVPCGRYFIPTVGQADTYRTEEEEKIREKLQKYQPMGLRNVLNKNITREVEPLKQLHPDIVAGLFTSLRGEYEPEEYNPMLDERMDPSLPEENWSCGLREAMVHDDGVVEDIEQYDEQYDFDPNQMQTPAQMPYDVITAEDDTPARSPVYIQESAMVHAPRSPDTPARSPVYLEAQAMVHAPPRSPVRSPVCGTCRTSPRPMSPALASLPRVVTPSPRRLPESPAAYTPSMRREPQTPGYSPSFVRRPQTPPYTPSLARGPQTPQYTPSLARGPQTPQYTPSLARGPQTPQYTPSLTRGPQTPQYTPSLTRRPQTPQYTPSMVRSQTPTQYTPSMIRKAQSPCYTPSMTRGPLTPGYRQQTPQAPSMIQQDQSPCMSPRRPETPTRSPRSPQTPTASPRLSIPPTYKPFIPSLSIAKSARRTQTPPPSMYRQAQVQTPTPSYSGGFIQRPQSPGATQTYPQPDTPPTPRSPCPGARQVPDIYVQPPTPPKSRSPCPGARRGPEIFIQPPTPTPPKPRSPCPGARRVPDIYVQPPTPTPPRLQVPSGVYATPPMSATPPGRVTPIRRTCTDRAGPEEEEEEGGEGKARRTPGIQRPPCMEDVASTCSSKPRMPRFPLSPTKVPLPVSPISLEPAATVPDNTDGATLDIIQRLVAEERQDVTASLELPPQLVTKINKMKMKPQSMRVLEETLNHSVPMEEESELLKSDQIASLLHSQEIGSIDPTSSPRKNFEQLFPPLADEAPVTVSPAAPAPLHDIVVPIGEAAPETVAVINEEIVDVTEEADRYRLEIPEANAFADATKSDIGLLTSPMPRHVTKGSSPKFEKGEFIPHLNLEEQKPPWAIDLDSLENLVGGKISIADQPSEDIPSDESIRGIAGKIEYILDVQKPLHYSCVQLRGSQMPAWFPGYFSVLPHVEGYIRLEKSPSRAFQAAWNVLAPHQQSQQSELLVL